MSAYRYSASWSGIRTACGCSAEGRKSASASASASGSGAASSAASFVVSAASCSASCTERPKVPVLSSFFPLTRLFVRWSLSPLSHNGRRKAKDASEEEKKEEKKEKPKPEKVQRTVTPLDAKLDDPKNAVVTKRVMVLNDFDTGFQYGCVQGAIEKVATSDQFLAKEKKLEYADYALHVLAEPSRKMSADVL